LVERLEPALRGPDQVALLDQVEREFDNLRVAMEWSIENVPETGQHLASMLKWFWHVRNHWGEGAVWLSRVLVPCADSQPNPGNESTLRRARALQVLTFLSGMLGDIETAMISVAESMALCEKIPGTYSERLMAENFRSMGMYTLGCGDVDQAKIFAEKSLMLYRKIGDKFGIAEVQSQILIWLALHLGDFDTAQALSESSLAIRMELGDKDGIADGLTINASIALGRGDYASAKELYIGAMDVCRETRAWHTFGLSLGNLGVTYLLDGDLRQAHEIFLQTVQFAREKANPILLAGCIYWSALLVFNQKQYRQFIQLFSAIADTKYYYSIIYYVPPIVQATFEQYILTAHEKLDKQVLDAAESEGKAMTLEQVFGLVEEILA
jgi:tetratricopeptide (TPR) repeat protein